MSCNNNCKKKTCHKCYPVQENCYDADIQNCPTPCPNGTYDTDCIFLKIENKSSALPNIGTNSTTSLTKVIQNINKYLSFSGAVNLSGINWYTFNPEEKDLSKVYNTVQHISDLFLSFKLVDDGLQEQITDLVFGILSLQTFVNTINMPQVSGVKTNVNTTDNIKGVLTKLIYFLENLSPTVVNNYNVDVEISSQQGNKTILLPDGIYTPDTSALTILDEICNTLELTDKFKQMVNKSGLKHRFYLSNSSASGLEVQYVSYENQTLTVSVPQNGGVEISNVKKVITNPSSTLTITYKGND